MYIFISFVEKFLWGYKIIKPQFKVSANSFLEIYSRTLQLHGYNFRRQIIKFFNPVLLRAQRHQDKKSSRELRMESVHKKWAFKREKYRPKNFGM